MSTFSSRLFAATTLVRNAVSTNDVWYVVEPANWAIRHVGHHITQQINHAGLMNIAMTASPHGIRNSAIHFGSLPAVRLAHPTNRVIASVFHIATSAHKQKVKRFLPYVHRWHTACSITAEKLRTLGIPSEHIHIIPLGVDHKIFQPTTAGARAAIRKRLGIPNGTPIIGSFQKDGVGWGEGNQPKMEKGPDILVETLAYIAKQRPIHVLLTGPARGYVTQRLDHHNISYTSLGYLAHSQDIAQYYAALDLYLISSRIEGGPLSLLEAWASAIPVVTTNVGMAKDIARDGHNTLVAKEADARLLAKLALRLLGDPDLATRIILHAQEGVRQHSWETISHRYYENLYRV